MRTELEFRQAVAEDAQNIAGLHADSWRRHYRGAYSDAFLDGDVVSDRRAVWASRLGDPSGTHTVIAEEAGVLIGFVHVIFGQDPVWGSLVDNLHVVHDHQRGGIGAQLLTHAGQAAADGAIFLWVLEQNTAAQGFYLACGATMSEAITLPPNPARLNGTPGCLRMTWPDGNTLARLAAARSGRVDPA